MGSDIHFGLSDSEKRRATHFAVAFLWKPKLISVFLFFLGKNQTRGIESKTYTSETQGFKTLPASIY